MASNEDIQQRIISYMNEKMGRPKPCVLCGHNAWILGSGYVILNVSDHPTETIMGRDIIPCIPVICGNCGNTHLVNLLVLGFTDEDFKEMRINVDAGR